MTTSTEAENRPRSIAMLAPGTPALVRQEALVILAELAQLRRLVDDRANGSTSPLRHLQSH